MNKNPQTRVIILGAASAIAEATARLYAAEGAMLVLVGRRRERLAAVAADLKVRGASGAFVFERDLASLQEIEADFARFVAMLGGVDHILIAYAVLGDQKTAEEDVDAADAILRADFYSTVAWTLVAAKALERQGNGSLVVIGSVAGDRGRRTNYVYAAAKAGLATLVQGIAHRFAGRNMRAVIVKPGSTITPMTEGFDRKGLLWATPEQVALVVRGAADRGGPTFYAPRFWRFIMLVIRFLPPPIFNRMTR